MFRATQLPHRIKEGKLREQRAFLTVVSVKIRSEQKAFISDCRSKSSKTE